ncbi:hypothetical protein [Granulicella sp. S190]|uniref:hypothetical protein n=1 Tax=Granulicella sp. S190 TaxID=1747226 RepID=UPI00131D6B83|nr:hypothetical protein [Granulicella sp. S190]
MNKALRAHPDLMRRFVATPFHFTAMNGPNLFAVQSNDLEIALGLRRHVLNHWFLGHSGSSSWKIVRDVLAPDNTDTISLFQDGTIRVLQAGTGTILLYDRERSEVLGFLSKKTSVEHMVSCLVPMLMGDLGNSNLSSFTKK